MRVGEVGLFSGGHTFQGGVRREPGPENALSSWRISLSHLTTEEEIAGFVQAFDRCYRELMR